jgi:GT2 family glycosyltransferase
MTGPAGRGVTVVVATRNRADELSRTLRELAALRPRPPVVVVDNASTDHTPDVVRCSPGARLIRLPANQGAAARNVGVAAATTRYVAFSDDDSWWAPDALRRAETVLDAHPEVGLLAARTLVGPRRREDPTNQLMAASPLGRDPRLPGPSVLGFLACAAVLRVSAYRQVGGFSPLLHFAAEETLLAYDLAAHGWALCYRADLVAHHHPSTHRPPSTERRQAELRNNALISWLRRPLGTALRDTAAMGGAGSFGPLGFGPLGFGAWGGLVRRLPLALRGRRPLPASVEHDIRLLREAPR